MPKCDFNKVVLQHYWNHTSVKVFSERLFLRTPMEAVYIRKELLLSEAYLGPYQTSMVEIFVKIVTCNVMLNFQYLLHNYFGRRQILFRVVSTKICKKKLFP